jgi:hypothetical protein
MLFYHILITGLWGFGIESNAVIAGGKDMLWIVMVLVSIWMQSTEDRMQSFRNIIKNKTIVLSAVILIVLSVVWVGYSYLIGTELSQIIIGFKYTLWPLVILMWSVVVGAVFNRNQKSEILLSHWGNSKCGAIAQKVHSVVNDRTSTSSVWQYIWIYSISSLSKIIVRVIIIWFVRQISKLILPDLFVRFW